LGLVTRCAVRLINSPPAIKTMMVSFRSDEAAGEAVSAIIAAGLATAATLSAWPDLAVGLGIALLNADAARQVIAAARKEQKEARA
jgi:Co/Zn/Cd efflux system component